MDPDIDLEIELDIDLDKDRYPVVDIHGKSGPRYRYRSISISRLT